MTTTTNDDDARALERLKRWPVSRGHYSCSGEDVDAVAAIVARLKDEVAELRAAKVCTKGGAV